MFLTLKKAQQYGFAEAESQSLLNQVSVSHWKKQLRQVKTVEGRNPLFIRSLLPTGESHRRYCQCPKVAIPYSSGLCFQQCFLDAITGLEATSQSLLHQVSVSNAIKKDKRITVSLDKSQSLIHQVSVSNEWFLDHCQLETTKCRNPLFVRSLFLTFNPCDYGDPWTKKSQSLLHQVYVSDERPRSPEARRLEFWRGMRHSCRNPFFIRSLFLAHLPLSSPEDISFQPNFLMCPKFLFCLVVLDFYSYQ